jgi:hypothetical protein
MMSFPSCGPCGRGAPKSFVYWTRPTTGKTIRSALTVAGLEVVVVVAGLWCLPVRPSPG